MAHDVFISYAVEDGEVAGEVCAALEGQSIKCWMAPRDVPYGMDYEEAILDAIEASQFLVLVFSSHANASSHVEREIRKASADCSDTKVFPFRIENVPYSKVLYYYLGGAQWIDASAPPLESHLERLVRHVRAHLKRGDEPPPGTPGPVVREPLISEPEVRADAVPVVSGTGDGGTFEGTGDGRSFKGTGDGRTFQGTGDGRKPFPLMWVAAGALLLAVVVAAVAFFTLDNGDATNTPPVTRATPAANLNADQQGNGNAQRPTPTPTPTRTPTRVFPRNINLRQSLNRNN